MMNQMSGEIPNSWQVQGALPVAGAGRLALEDLYSVSTPAGELVLDVGWSPPGDSNGQFVCALVMGDNWDAPVDRLTTADVSEVRKWIAATLGLMKVLYGVESEHRRLEASPVEINGDLEVLWVGPGGLPHAA